MLLETRSISVYLGRDLIYATAVAWFPMTPIVLITFSGGGRARIDLQKRAFIDAVPFESSGVYVDDLVKEIYFLQKINWDAPDAGCVTTPDGDCHGTHCMHIASGDGR